MLQRCSETWKGMGLQIKEDDFYQWYSEVMRPNSPYIVHEGQEVGTPGKKKKGRISTKGRGASGSTGPKKHHLAKQEVFPSGEEDEEEEPTVSRGGWKGTGGEKGGAGSSASAEGNGRAVGSKGTVAEAEGSQNGGRGKGVGLKNPSPPVVSFPVLSHESKMESVVRTLQAKVHRLENDLAKELDRTENMHEIKAQVRRLKDSLRIEEERTENLVEGKQRYKSRVIELTEMQEGAESVIKDLKKKLKEVRVMNGELEKLRLAVEEFLRERVILQSGRRQDVTGWSWRRS